MLKRGLLNKLRYTFNWYFLVNDHNDLIYGAVLLFISLMHFLLGRSLLIFCCWGEVVVPSEPPKKRENQENSEILNHGGESWTRTQRFLKSVLIAHHFIANILSKASAVPVYCLFVFACLFFLLWQFFCLFLFSVYKPASEYWNRVKRWTFQNKWQNMNCYKSNKVLCMLSRFCVSNGARCLSSLVRQK